MERQVVEISNCQADAWTIAHHSYWDFWSLVGGHWISEPLSTGNCCGQVCQYELLYDPFWTDFNTHKWPLLSDTFTHVGGHRFGTISSMIFQTYIAEYLSLLRCNEYSHRFRHFNLFSYESECMPVMCFVYFRCKFSMALIWLTEVGDQSWQPYSCLGSTNDLNSVNITHLSLALNVRNIQPVNWRHCLVLIFICSLNEQSPDIVIPRSLIWSLEFIMFIDLLRYMWLQGLCWSWWWYEITSQPCDICWNLLS